jgi:hypothetical protein
MTSSAKTYALYADGKGGATPHWQYMGRATVPGCIIEQRGCVPTAMAPPWFEYVVRAKDIKQACYFARSSTMSCDRADHLGIWWKRSEHEHESPPSLGRDMREYATLIAECGRGRSASLWHNIEDAKKAKARIDHFGCGGLCHGNHWVQPMTINEAKKIANPCWTPNAPPIIGFPSA